MVRFTRRQWLAGLAAAPLARAQKSPLPITDYQPKSMLHVRETIVPQARYPVIDIHTHLTWCDTLVKTPQPVNNASPEEILPIMDRKNIRTMVNLTGGCGPALDEPGSAVSKNPATLKYKPTKSTGRGKPAPAASKCSKFWASACAKTSLPAS